MTNKLFLFVFASIALVGGAFPKPGLAVQSPPSDSELWFKGNNIAVTTTDRAQRNSASWKLESNDNGDLMLECDERQGSAIEKGTIIVVSGRAMLARGLKLEKGYEIDALDGPMLTIKLVLTLLSRAFPDGPGSIGVRSSIDLVENQLPISISTTSAGGEIPPPWTLKGNAGFSATGIAQFNMTFTHSDPDKPNENETMRFAGTWQLSPTSLVIADDFPLKDWQIYSLGPIKVETGNGGTIYDYGAGRMKRFATLGELRKAIGSDQKTSGSVEVDSRKAPGRKAPKMSSN